MNQGSELSMAPICALHNESQAGFIAPQQFVAAKVSDLGAESGLFYKNTIFYNVLQISV
jgi:hypothetical protein